MEKNLRAHDGHATGERAPIVYPNAVKSRTTERIDH
jgi:hypothetical protein